jgi:hypothetical protein
MNLPIIYLGPSLEINKAKKIIDADFKPPAKKGDFINLNLLTERRDIRIRKIWNERYWKNL